MNKYIDKSKILIIRNPNVILDKKLLQNRGYQVEEAYRFQNNIFLRKISKWHMKLKLPFYHIWFNTKILDYTVETIIIFESSMHASFIEWVDKHQKKSNIHVWYWNIVKNTLDPFELRNTSATLWSFSRIDCLKYGMKFNPAPYFEELIDSSLTNIECPIDILFVGKDKGRIKELKELESKFKDMNFKTCFIITPTKSYYWKKGYSKPITYKKTLQLGLQSRCLLDYIEVDDAGQSLRIFEALFTEKKVITNNKLIKDYDFYNPKNIFILNYDDINSLEEFVFSDYVPVPEDIVKKYDFDTWVSRFFHEDPNISEMMEMIEEIN